jgi:hypothetical protein
MLSSWNGNGLDRSKKGLRGHREGMSRGNHCSSWRLEEQSNALVDNLKTLSIVRDVVAGSHETK